MPGKIVGWIVGILMALAGPLVLGYGGWWLALDRPGWHAPWPVSFIGWSAGANAQLAQDAQTIAAWKAAFTTEQVSFGVERDAVEQCSAASLKASTDSQTWQARSVAAVHQAAQSNAWRETLAASILATKEPVGEDALTQCRSAEAVLRIGGQ